MPNRVKRNSVVEMLAKVPVNRGSLLQSIENLLKTIESSESAVMIPTLLRDKCEFDAWELLFVAKILKASILGHSDLVEFYMNHIGHSSNQFSQPANGHQANNNGNGCNLFSAPASTTGSYDASLSQQALLSPSQTTVLMALNRQPASPIASCSPMSLNGLHSAFADVSLQQQQQMSPLSQKAQAQSGKESPVELDSIEVSPLVPLANPNQALLDSQNAANGSDSLAKPLQVRLAQPPSLLQLTTTNNHINSVAQAVVNGVKSNGSSINGTSSASSYATTTNNNNNIEQISQQLKQLNGSPPSSDSALSISTVTANQQSAASLPRTPTASSALSGTGCSPSGQPIGRSEASSTINQHYQQHMPELRTSRSAGCLFRANSGASSPRTPLQTPSGGLYPQAETLAASNKRALDGLSGDPKAPVRLLHQIEQLKSSICHVTHLLESVVELYKKSIDDIA